MAASTSSQDEPFTGINVTPLTDVMLVLLITFLLSASSFESSNLTVELPQVRESAEIKRMAQVVQVLADGTIDWGDPSLQGLDPEQAMKALLEKTDKRVMALAVHHECRYREFFPVALAASKAGWTQTVVLTAPIPAPTESREGDSP